MRVLHPLLIVIAVMVVAFVLCAVAWFVNRIIRWSDTPEGKPPHAEPAAPAPGAIAEPRCPIDAAIASLDAVDALCDALIEQHCPHKDREDCDCIACRAALRLVEQSQQLELYEAELDTARAATRSSQPDARQLPARGELEPESGRRQGEQFDG